MKKRKTYDEYHIEGNYGQGWEIVTVEDTLLEARKRLKEYRENEPYSFILVKRRIKIEETNLNL